MIQRLFLILLFPMLLGIAMLLLFGGLLDAGLIPPCRINEWTGWYCPGCGGTRALQALGRGDLMAAIRMNPLGLAFMLVLGILVFRTSWEAAFPERPWRRLPISDRWAWGVLITVVIFTVLRNLPWWPFPLLAPH